MSLNQRKLVSIIYCLLAPFVFVFFVSGCATGPALQEAEVKAETKQPTIEDIQVATSNNRSTVKIVGSMETDGTSFQSATADLKDVAIKIATRRLPTQPCKNRIMYIFNFFPILLSLHNPLRPLSRHSPESVEGAKADMPCALCHSCLQPDT